MTKLSESYRNYDRNCPRCARTVRVEVGRHEDLGDRYLRRTVSAHRLFLRGECDCKLDRDEWREIAQEALKRHEEGP
jgi:hypothetical protein